ncbi:TetR/AcrR family transcriptional regulator [Streptomyces sp. NPDC048278]|uniref:TetR/AcrR family transcriptional regulator n=1 Tax=unclassified Streptomyces TaxID=2593676 RepID=UPI003424063D
MSPRTSDSRERMLRGASDLLGEYGAGATSIDRVLARTGAPRGSVYHHFPGGRAQLVEEAVTRSGDVMAKRIDAAVAAEDQDPVAALDSFFALWRQRLTENGYRVGCPVAAVAAATNDEAPQLARSAAAVFARWQQALAAHFHRHGLAQARSTRLAAFVVAALEGAVIMCRAEQTTAPLDATAAELRELLTRAFQDR